MRYCNLVVATAFCLALLVTATPTKEDKRGGRGASPAKAGRAADPQRQTIDYYSNAPCSSDWAHFEGWYNTFMECPQGNGNCHFHYNEHVTITVVATGVKYQMDSAASDVVKANFDSNPPYRHQYNVRVRVTEQGSGLVFTGTILVSYSYDPSTGAFLPNDKQYKWECT